MRPGQSLHATLLPGSDELEGLTQTPNESQSAKKLHPNLRGCPGQARAGVIFCHPLRPLHAHDAHLSPMGSMGGTRILGSGIFLTLLMAWSGALKRGFVELWLGSLEVYRSRGFRGGMVTREAWSGGREGLGHRFAEAWVRAAFGDGKLCAPRARRS